MFFQDPLCVLSGNIPAWLIEIVQSCPFLFPFDLRRYLFYITTFDRQRAIQKLNERMPEYEVSFFFENVLYVNFSKKMASQDSFLI